MIKFTDEMKQRINNAYRDRKPCLWVTASKAAVPGVSFRGSTLVWDDDHLAFWERTYQSGTARSIEENPIVLMLYVDLPARLGWRFYGEAKIYEDGEIRQKIMSRVIQEELDKDPERKGKGVLIRVDRILYFANNTVLQER